MYIRFDLCCEDITEDDEFYSWVYESYKSSYHDIYCFHNNCLTQLYRYIRKNTNTKFNYCINEKDTKEFLQECDRILEIIKVTEFCKKNNKNSKRR